MTHLQAFLSDDAKQGRAWTDGELVYQRLDDEAYFKRAKNYSVGDTAVFPYRLEQQVAAIKGEVRWADEPKTITPQEAEEIRNGK